MKNKKYTDFESWFDELESYGLRSERFYDTLDAFTSKEALYASMKLWLEAAFNSARQKRYGCTFPDCFCVAETCEYVPKITRNPI